MKFILAMALLGGLDLIHDYEPTAGDVVYIESRYPVGGMVIAVNPADYGREPYRRHPTATVQWFDLRGREHQDEFRFYQLVPAGAGRGFLQ